MYAVALFALASTAIAAPLATREEADAPAHWATGYLEDYQTYHTRYLALGCQDQHNTTFFDDCCHPLLATENLVDNREAYCTPNATQASSAAAYESSVATASATASADVDAESEYCDAVNSTTAYGSASASATWSSVAAAETSEVAEAKVQAAEATSAAPTSEWVAPTTTSSEEQPAQTEASNNNDAPSGDVKTGGYATFFYQNGNAGACGTVHADSDKVIAIDANGYWGDYASNSNSDHCGKWINIKNTNNGKTVTAMVADVCPTCVSDNSLDLSVGAFTAIAEESEGSVPIEWSWA